jgi:excisionase family DNA binding protein
MLPYLQVEQTKRLLSAEDLARELGVGRTTAYSLLWSGTIPSMKVGRLRKVRREDLEAYIRTRLERSEHGGM